MPYIPRMFGHVKTYNFNMLLWALTFAALSALSFIVHAEEQNSASVMLMLTGMDRW